MQNGVIHPDHNRTYVELKSGLQTHQVRRAR